MRFCSCLLVLLLVGCSVFVKGQNSYNKTVISTSSNKVFGICFADSGKVLAIADGQNIILYSLSKKSIIRRFGNGHTRTILSIDISKDNRFLVSCGQDGNVIVWDFLSGKKLTVLRNHTGTVNKVKISKDNRYVVSGGVDHKLVVYDLENKKVVSVIKDSKEDISVLTFSNLNDLLAVSGKDNVIRMYRVGDWVKTDSLIGHKRWVRDLCFSNDDSILVSCGDDKRVLVWANNSNGIFLKQKLKIDSDWLLCVDIKDDNKTFVTGGLSGKIWVESSLNKFNWTIKYPVNDILFIPNSKDKVSLVISTYGGGVLLLNY